MNHKKAKSFWQHHFENERGVGIVKKNSCQLGG